MSPLNIDAIVALFVPLLVAALKKTTSSQTENSIIAILIYVVVGVAAVVVSGQTIDPTNLVPTITLFVTEGTAAYVLFWKNVETPVTMRLRG